MIYDRESVAQELIRLGARQAVPLSELVSFRVGGPAAFVLTPRGEAELCRALELCRAAKALNIPIFFTKENINTMDAGGEVLVTILASIAQQESASISQNVQIGVRYHYQEGKVCSGVHRLLGYNRTKDGALELVPHEAMIVRRIFREYLDGYSIGHIAKRLSEEGVDGSKVTTAIDNAYSNASYERMFLNKPPKLSIFNLSFQRHYDVL